MNDNLRKFRSFQIGSPYTQAQIQDHIQDGRR